MNRGPIYGKITKAHYNGNSVSFSVKADNGECCELNIQHIWPNTICSQSDLPRQFTGYIRLTEKNDLDYDVRVVADVALPEGLQYPHQIEEEDYTGCRICINFCNVQ